MVGPSILWYRKMTDKFVKELVGSISVFQIYLNMFRQTFAIFRVS
jgi:hypothetical protein